MSSKKRRGPKRSGGKRKSMTREGVVRALGAHGDGIVVSDGLDTFVAGVFPGERVEFSVTLRGEKAESRGALLRVLEPHPDRRADPCPVTECGGCDWQGLRPDAQQRLKQQQLENALGIPAEVVGSAVPYRRVARMQLEGKQLGYRRRGSRAIVDVPACRILNPALASIVSWFRSDVLGTTKGTASLRLGVGVGGRGALSLNCDMAQPPELYALLEDAVSSETVAGVRLSADGVIATWGDPRHHWSSAGRPLIEADVDAFVQANDEANDHVINTVLSMLPERVSRCVELFAGSGNLSLPLAAHVESLQAIESDQLAVDTLRQHHGIDAVLGDAYQWHPGKKRVDVVVADPPRIGLQGLAESLAECTDLLVLVACDVVALRRDADVLRENGFEVTRAVAIDMFPETHHFESIVLFSRVAG